MTSTTCPFLAARGSAINPPKANGRAESATETAENFMVADMIFGEDFNIRDASKINRSAESNNDYRVLTLTERREDRVSEVQLLE